MQNELSIPFESLLNRGIQRELITPDNNSGFLNNTYIQAFTLIKVICATSERMTGKQSCQDEIHNVIAFTGRRGTGKTSAMLSIADSLSKLSAEKGNRFEISDAFVQMPYINVAILDEEEDIFLIVLSRMFKELDAFSSGTDRMYKKDFHDEVRKLREEMCNIHGHYVNLKSNSDLTSSYYSMENLHAKYNIREKFAELVKNYTEFYKNHETKNMTHLILCIDDVDMSRQDHMRIMQCIHQYFMIPNVVVMVTLNFPILTATLQKDTFDRLNTIEKREEQNLHLAFEHTHDFLRKIIPSDMRITMPSWRKYDYRNLTPVKVNLGQADSLDVLEKEFPLLRDSVLFKKLSEHKDEDYTLSPKELVLMMLADRTKVYLDVKGNKLHFMEPDSLRNLYDIFYMLYHMNDIASLEDPDRRNDSYFRDRKANRKILLDYLYFKLLPEYDFSAEEEKLISDFLAEPMDRRGKRIWDYYFKRLNSEEEEKRIISVYGRKFYEDEKGRYKIENYSFGELFRVLYSASRIGVMDRKLIRFILASFSFSLPQYVENEKWRNSCRNKEHTGLANNYRNLRDVFGYTLIGTWCSDMFNGYQIDAVIYTDKIADLCNKHKKKGVSKKVNIKNDSFRDFIEELMLLLLMTSKTTREPLNVRDDKRYGEKTSKEIEFFRIENSIDPTAFLMNSLRIGERFGNMKFRYKADEFISDRDVDGNVTCYAVSKLLSMIFKELGKEISAKEFNELVKERLEKWGNVDSVFYDCKNGNYKTLWYLLKHTDIAYNVIKRAVSYIIYSSENNLKDKKLVTSTPFHTIQKFYEVVCEKLVEQDKVYFKNDSPNKYAPVFSEHPVVKKFYVSSEYRHYGESMTSGCGIEKGMHIDYVSHSTLKYTLTHINSDNAKQLANSFPIPILIEFLKKEQIQSIIDIIYSMDSYGLDMRTAYNMIIRVVEDENQLVEVMDELDHIEERFLSDQIAQEEAENDPPQ